MSKLVKQSPKIFSIKTVEHVAYQEDPTSTHLYLRYSDGCWTNRDNLVLPSKKAAELEKAYKRFNRVAIPNNSKK